MRVIAVDLGATSAKVFSTEFDGERIIMEEIGRFRTRGSRVPTHSGEILVWNLPRFLDNLKEILESEQFESISFDSWGVDFALFDDRGRLVSLPYHYRDRRTEGVMEKALKIIDRWELYERTGIQFMPINTIYQLYSMVFSDDPFLRISKKLLMTANVFSYWLSGEMFAERTLASTSQMMDLNGNWAFDILERLSIPIDILPSLVDSREVFGRKPKIVAGASHDTAAAVVSVPFEKRGIFVSLGTWALVGVELDKPLVTMESFEENFSNERGVDGKIRFLKNTTGMWILEECNSEWKYDYGRLVKEARNEKANSFINPDDEIFLPAGNMCERIADYLENRGMEVPKSIGEMARMIIESIAYNLAYHVFSIERITGEEYEVVHVVGGGARNELIAEILSEATGKIVKTGPYEATAAGNSLVQLMALGQLSSLEEAREVVRNSFEIKSFEPRGAIRFKERFEEWKEEFKK